MGSLVIVVTTESYDLIWGKTKTWLKNKQLTAKVETEVRYQSINGNLVVVFCHPNGAIDEVVKAVKHYESYSDVYIAAHMGRVSWSAVQGRLGGRLKGKADFNHEEEPGEDTVCDVLVALVQRPSPVTLNSAIEEIKNQQSLDLAKRISSLKHRIVHLFLSIDVNLQTAEEMAGEGKTQEAQAILKESARSLQRKLEEAQKLLGESGNIVDEESDGQKKQIAQAYYDKVSKLLGSPPQLQLNAPPKPQARAFHEWLKSLDMALNELREAMTS